MLQPYIDRPHQLRNTIVRCRIMKYRIYLLRKSFFQLHCRFSACCDSESNHSVLGHRKNVAEELHGMDSVTGWLPVWRSTLTRMELGKNHGHPATNVSVSSVVLPIAAMFCCRFAARTLKNPLECDVTQLRGRVFAMRWTTFAMIHDQVSHPIADAQRINGIISNKRYITIFGFKHSQRSEILHFPWLQPWAIWLDMACFCRISQCDLLCP